MPSVSVCVVLHTMVMCTFTVNVFWFCKMHSGVALLCPVCYCTGWVVESARFECLFTGVAYGCVPLQFPIAMPCCERCPQPML